MPDPLQSAHTYHEKSTIWTWHSKRLLHLPILAHSNLRAGLLYLTKVSIWHIPMISKKHKDALIRCCDSNHWLRRICMGEADWNDSTCVLLYIKAQQCEIENQFKFGSMWGLTSLSMLQSTVVNDLFTFNSDWWLHWSRLSGTAYWKSKPSHIPIQESFLCLIFQAHAFIYCRSP